MIWFIDRLKFWFTKKKRKKTYKKRWYVSDDKWNIYKNNWYWLEKVWIKNKRF